MRNDQAVCTAAGDRDTAGNIFVKERPILFSGPMVRAIREGRKTQTRRVLKPHPVSMGVSSYGGERQGYTWKPESLNRSWNEDDANPYRGASLATAALACECPHGKPGDRLWVRETFCDLNTTEWGRPCLAFAADCKDDPHSERLRQEYGYRWTPSIFMPRWASRLTLEVVSVKVERLQGISRADAVAEGIYLNENDFWTAGKMGPGKVLAGLDCPEAAYGRLWEFINGPGSWLVNPWVWVVEFKVVGDTDVSERRAA